MDSPKPYRRKFRNFLIYPKFQVGLLAIQAAVLVLAFGLVQAANHVVFARLARKGMDAGLSPNHPYFQFIKEQSGQFTSYALLAFLGALLISSCVTLYLSFRLAGPIYRLRNYLSAIATEGGKSVEPLRFRDGDFYSDLPDVVNQAVDRMKRDHR